LFDLFQVSVLHNIVHLLFGVAGLVMARRVDTARVFLVGGGVVYLVLWLYGMIIDLASEANFVPFDDADNWLHFGLGVGMIGLGLVVGRKREEGRSDTVRHRP
jgi:predicted transporter